MEEKVLNTRLIQKHDRESRWNAATNFIPKQGEQIIYDDRYTDDSGQSVIVSPRSRLKIGDGITRINDLPFIDAQQQSQIDAATDLLLSTISAKLGGTDGLTYAVLQDGTGYSVKGSSTGALTAIASEYENLPVLTIAKSGFAGNTGLSNIYIPQSVTSIGNSAFSGCTGLTSVTIGNGVTSIDYGAFQGCSSLTSVTIPDSVTSIESAAFQNCTRLTSITIPNNVKSIRSRAFIGTAYYNNSENWNNGVLYIGKHLINAKSSISGSYEIKSGTLTIADSAFSSCTKLTSVKIPRSIKSISGEAFQSCTGLTSVTIPNSVTSIDDCAFHDCSRLTSITIPTSVNSIGYGAFQYCSSLTSITIPNKVTSISSGTFQNCTRLTSITIPDSVTSIGSYAFNGCNSLTSITIPNSVTSIGADAFSGCTALIYNEYDNACYLGNTNNPHLALIKAKDTSIGSCNIHQNTKFIQAYAFSYCNSLTSITIPDSITSISSWTFHGCSSLTTIDVQGNLTRIEAYAFAGCTSMEFCYFMNCTSVPTLESTSAFDAVPSSCRIIVPSALADDWRNATNWSEYSNYIVGMG